MRTFQKITVKQQPSAGTNEDINPHDSDVINVEQTKEPFNLTNLAQRGAPTYVDFKSKEEYMKPASSLTTNGNEVHEEPAGKLSRIKSIFNISTPDLSPKAKSPKTSVRKWFSFSKVEDLKKSTESRNKTESTSKQTKRLEC